MGTVPTGKMERDLRAAYLRWLAHVDSHQADLPDYVNTFKNQATAIITKAGGQIASLGAAAGFPVPRLLELSPRAGAAYDTMVQAGVQASIAAGLNATDAARQMLHAGLGKGFNQLNRVARTETVSAYWRNQWDSAGTLPGIVMVWGAENGPRTCQYCESRDGLVVEDGNIRDHPQGRCTLIPTLRSQLHYKGTLQPDGTVTQDPAYTQKPAKVIDMSAGPTTAEQRDPLSGKTNPAAPSKALPQQASKPQKTTETRAKITAPKATPPAAKGVAREQVSPAAVKAGKVKPTKAPAQYNYKKLQSVDDGALSKKLVKSETDGLFDYTQDGYESIQRELRGGRGSKKARASIEGIDSAMSKADGLAAGKVNRGEGLEEWKKVLGFNPKDPQAVVGKSYQTKGYMSTFVDDKDFKAFAFTRKPLQLEIHVAPGTKGFRIDSGQPFAEQEVLLDRDLMVTVMSVEERGGKYYAKVLVSGGKNR